MITKPQWLESFLALFNWTIFQWHVNPGDAIETAIDWVIGIINTIIEWAQAVGSWLAELTQEIKDGFAVFVDNINKLWQWVLNLADTIRDVIAAWWSGVQETVKGWIQVAIDSVTELIQNLTKFATQIGAKLDQFFTDVLPDLVRKFELTDLLTALLLPFRGLFNFWEDRWRDITAFFADPYEFIYLRFERWLDLFLKRYL